MPILSMCEWIRRKLMKMFVAKRPRVSMSKQYKSVDTSHNEED